jgi:predicted RNA-binding Zn-ribbon protein involved in translation (DUF1610 family)
MAQTQMSAALSETIEARPTCPECGAKMWLVRVERIGPDEARRTFECPACEVVLEQL